MRKSVAIILTIVLIAISFCFSCAAGSSDPPAISAAVQPPAQAEPPAVEPPAPDPPVLDETYAANAVVTWIGLEGGFWGLVTSPDKDRLDPMKPLPPEFQKDGLRVKIRYIPRKDLASVHMWGLVIDLRSIEAR